MNLERVYDECLLDRAEPSDPSACQTEVRDRLEDCARWRAPFCDRTQISDFVFRTRAAQTQRHVDSQCGY